jgi:hypothetical protein
VRILLTAIAHKKKAMRGGAFTFQMIFQEKELCSPDCNGSSSMQNYGVSKKPTPYYLLLPEGGFTEYKRVKKRIQIFNFPIMSSSSEAKIQRVWRLERSM